MKRLPIRLLLSLVIAALPSACAARAAAQPAEARSATPASPSARIRIADGSKRPLELLVSIADRGSSKVEARAGSAFYRIEVSHVGAPDSDRPLHFKIERSDSAGQGMNNVEVSVSVRMRPGARVVLARLSRPDGSTTTVTAALE